MKQALIVSIVSIMLFAACSSNTPNKTQYYLLNSPTSSSTADTQNEKVQNVVITLLELPDYLKQPNLVLQLSEHQLHYSHFHMWAEPLQSSFAQALGQDLNNVDSRFNYIPTPATNQETAETVVVVNITAFHATHQSQAILAGSYWLQGNELESKIKSNNFKFTVELTENGYEHAVTQMRKVITPLARQITSSVLVE